jgi:hypothetical protein
VPLDGAECHLQAADRCPELLVIPVRGMKNSGDPSSHALHLRYGQLTNVGIPSAFEAMWQTVPRSLTHYDNQRWIHEIDERHELLAATVSNSIVRHQGVIAVASEKEGVGELDVVAARA